MSPLLYAALNRTTSIDIYKILLATGAEINQLTSQGQNCLMIYMRHKHLNPKVIKLFLDTGVNVNQVDCYGLNIISHLLQHHSESRVVPLILSRGFNLYLLDEEEFEFVKE